MASGVNQQSDLAPAHSLHPRSRTANDTGSSVDLANYFRASVVVHGGPVAGIISESHALRLEESDDDVTFTTVSASDLNGSLPTITSASSVGTVTEVEYLGNARYLRVYASVTSPTSGAIYGATIIRSGARTNPA